VKLITLLDFNLENNGGLSSLHVAKSLDIIKYLMEKGGENPPKALISSASRGQLNVVSFLVEKGADVNVSDNDGQTPLIGAASSGNQKIMEFLVKNNALIDAKDTSMKTALHHGICSNIEIVKFLVENNASIRERDSDGMTVLHIASKNDEVDIVEYLVGKGADLEEKDDKGFTPSEYSSNDDILRFLINHGGKIESISATFHYAASCGNLHMVKHLLEKMKANIEDRNEAGQTALHHSAYNSHEDVAKYLIVKKAKVNAKYFEGRTPLLIASSGVFDNPEVPDLLIKNGADVNAVDQRCPTWCPRAFFCPPRLFPMPVGFYLEPNSLDV
jgi:ankyrin repeat protein